LIQVIRVRYVELEDEARTVLNYETSFAPGLLQTEDYARVRGVLPEATHAEVNSRVKVRMRRQEVLTRDNAARFWAIVGEGALRHRVGGVDVMRRQMLRLAEAVDEPNITLQVLPFAAGAHPGMLGSFHVLRFGQDELPDVVYIDSMAGDLFLDGPADVERYTVTFEHLCAIALSPEGSIGLITKLADSWEDRFGARLIHFGGTLDVSVAAPPRPDQASRLALEHFLACPDNILQDQSVVFATYAERLVHARMWSFWWD
jgi:hypothetical protein